MADQDTKRRWLPAAGVILLLSLALGFWFGFRDVSTQQPQVAANQAAPARPVVRNTPPVGRAPEANSPVSANTPVPDVKPEIPAELPPEEEDDFRAQLHPRGGLRFLTLNKKPAVGVKVELSYHRQMSLEVDKNLVEEKVTDELGQVQLASPDCFSGLMAVKVLSEGWQIPPGTPLQDGWRIAGPMAVVLERTRRIQVTAEYADGQPYDGQVLIGRETATVPEPVEMTRGTVDATVPADDPFYISVESRRPGFAAVGASYTREKPAPVSVKFILPAEEPKLGVIEVDLTAFARADQLLVEVIGVPVPWDLDFRTRTIGGGVYVSPPRKPAAYRVFVREDPDGKLTHNKGQFAPDTARSSIRVWQSEVVQVKAGETVRVVALSQQASAVRARLVNESGAALAPGIIFVEPDLKVPNIWRNLEGWYEYPKPWSKVEGWRPWMTLEDGTAELPIVDPGKRLIGCEAPGYDITFVEVECLPGQLHDLGTVVLKPATGVIEIEIINFDPNLTYTVTIDAWTSTTLLTIVLTGETGPKYRFEGLALRWYIICVNNDQRKVGAWSRCAKLSKDRKTARLQFEMLPPPLPPKVNQPDEE